MGGVEKLILHNPGGLLWLTVFDLLAYCDQVTGLLYNGVKIW